MVAFWRNVLGLVNLPYLHGIGAVICEIRGLKKKPIPKYGFFMPPLKRPSGLPNGSSDGELAKYETWEEVKSANESIRVLFSRGKRLMKILST